MFGRREFAGYLKRPIPHPLDARVLAVLEDPVARSELGPEDADVLAVFGHRKATEAVRSASLEALSDGFLGVAVALDLHGDVRNVFLALAPMFHSARLLHVPDNEAIAWVSGRGASPYSVAELTRFSQRPETGKSLAAMGLRAEGEGRAFRYT